MSGPIEFVQPDTGVVPHKDGSTCGSCLSQEPGTELLPFYEVVDGVCIPFIRAVKKRVDGKFECLGDLTVSISGGYDVQDEANVWPGYPAPPDKSIAKIYKTGSATFCGAGTYTEADLEIPAGWVITALSISAQAENNKGTTLKGGCGPADCSLIELEAGNTVNWSEDTGFIPPVFELTIFDTPATVADDKVEVTFTICGDM